MDTREERRQRFQREQQTIKRLRMATTRLREAEQERIWAIVAASDAGLSIRQIATATGLSRSRIHQLLQEPAAREIPAWLTHRVGATTPQRVRPTRRHLPLRPPCRPASPRRSKCCGGALTGSPNWNVVRWWGAISALIPRVSRSLCGLIRPGWLGGLARSAGG